MLQEQSDQKFEKKRTLYSENIKRDDVCMELQCCSFLDLIIKCSLFYSETFANWLLYKVW